MTWPYMSQQISQHMFVQQILHPLLMANKFFTCYLGINDMAKPLVYAM